MSKDWFQKVFFPQGVGSAQRDGRLWGPTDAHGASPGSTYAPTWQPHAWESFPWSRWAWTGHYTITSLYVKVCEWVLTSRCPFLFSSRLWLLALGAYGNSCPATGAHSQAKHRQVCAQNIIISHRHSTYTTLCTTFCWTFCTFPDFVPFLELWEECDYEVFHHLCCTQTYLKYLYVLSFRMEMNAILHQKELENAHQKGLIGIDNPMAYPSNHMAFRGRQRMPDGHDVFVHRPTLDELHSNSILMSASPYPPISTLHRERGRRAGRRPTAHKSAESHVANLKGQTEDKNVEQSPGATSGEEKDSEAKGDMGEECATSKTHHQAKIESELTGSRKNYKEGDTSACARPVWTRRTAAPMRPTAARTTKTFPASVQLSRRSSCIPQQEELSRGCLTCSQSLEMASSHLVSLGSNYKIELNLLNCKMTSKLCLFLFWQVHGISFLMVMRCRRT